MTPLDVLSRAFMKRRIEGLEKKVGAIFAYSKKQKKKKTAKNLRD